MQWMPRAMHSSTFLAEPRLECPFGEPKPKLTGSGVRIAAAVRQVVFDAQREITANGARGGIDGVGGPHHRANRLHGILTLNGQGHDWSARQVVANRTEERSLAVLVVVGLHGRSFSLNELQANNSQTSGFNATCNFADQISLNSAGLDQDEGSFQCHRFLQFTGPPIS